MADNGIIIIGGQVTGYSERNVTVLWDIAPDLISERHILIETPYFELFTSRYVTHQHIQYVYCTRWMICKVEEIPLTERKIFVHYALCTKSERTIYYYPDTRERLMFTEGLYTQTPLLLKYPKYFNWSYIPQVINPEFKIWSYYDLNELDITVKITSVAGFILYMNSGVHKDKFIISKDNEYIYTITVIIDHVFDPSDTVSCHVTAFDIKQNYLKPGMW